MLKHYLDSVFIIGIEPDRLAVAIISISVSVFSLLQLLAF